MSEETKVATELQAGADVTAQTVINLPENFDEVLAEKVAKAMEAKEKAQKKFHFSGKESDKAELSVAEKRLEVHSYIKYVSVGDYAQASSLSAVSSRAKALDSQTTNTAGVLVPELFEKEIYSNFDSYDEIMGDAKVKDYAGPGDIVNLNQLDAKVTVYETAELGKTTASNPSYSAPNLEFTKYTAEVIMSEELLEDTEADLMGNLSEQIGEQLAAELQDRFVNRSTSDQLGLMQIAGVITITMGNTGSYLKTTFADLYAMKSRLASSYNKSEANTGKYYMSPGTWSAVINNTTTAGNAWNNYMVNPFEGTPTRAHGGDVRVLNEIASPTVTGTKFVLFADLKKHLIVGRKRGMRMKVNTTGTASDGTNLNTQDARQLVMTARMGHVIVLPGGIVVLVS